MAQENAPNYRVSDNPPTVCSNCFFGGAEGVCRLYDFTFDQGYICDSWEPPSHGGVMIVLMPSPIVADDLAQDIPFALQPEDLHLTLAFLGNKDEIGIDRAVLADTVAQVASSNPPLFGNITGQSVFQNNGNSFIVALVDSPNLPSFRENLRLALSDEGIDVSMVQGFMPHITLANVPEGEELPEIDVPKIENIAFGILYLSWGDELSGFEFEQEPVFRGRVLGSNLNDAVDDYVADGRTHDDIVGMIADDSGDPPSVINDILSGEINCPDRECLQSFANILPSVSMSDIESWASEDGCNTEREQVAKQKRGTNLSTRLNNLLDDLINDERTRSDIVDEMADAAGIESGTVNQILNESIDCPPLDRLEGLADFFNVSMDSVISAAEEDGCTYERERKIGLLKRMMNGFASLFETDQPPETAVSRAIKQVDEWDGSASRWDTTDAYCQDTLIDVNEAAGRDEKAQSHCFLPIREPGDSADTFVAQAVFAAAGGRGITQIERPSDVPQADWDTAVESAAKELISAYEEMDRVAPDDVFELAGQSPPEERDRNCPTCFNSRFLSMDKKQRAVAMNRVWDQAWSALESDDREFNLSNEDERFRFSWLMDIYWDRGTLYALVARDGMLFRRDITVGDDTVALGDEIRVVEQHMPTIEQERQITRVSVTRQKNGRYRGTIIASVAALNRIGEIDSSSLFDSFIKHATTNNDYPIITAFHLGDSSRIGQADFLARDGFVYICSFLFDDTKFGNASARGITANPSYWGNSIEFTPMKRDMIEVVPDIRIPVYSKGRNTAVTILAERNAASLFTAHSVSTNEVNRMNKRLFKDIQKLLDDDPELAEQFAELVDHANGEIRSNGLIARSTDDDDQSDSDEDNNEENPDLELDEDLLAEVIAGVTSSEAFSSAMQQDSERLGRIESMLADLTSRSKKGETTLRSFEKRLFDLEGDDDDRKRKWQDDLPKPKPRRRATYRPRDAQPPATSNSAGDESSTEVAGRALSKIPNYA